MSRLPWRLVLVPVVLAVSATASAQETSIAGLRPTNVRTARMFKVGAQLEC